MTDKEKKSSIPTAAVIAAVGPPPSSTLSSPSSASSPPPPSPSSSLPRDLFDTPRAWAQSACNGWHQQQVTAKRAWNNYIAAPINDGARTANVSFQSARQQYPAAIVGASTALVFAASIPFGRFAMLRNTVFAGLLSSLFVSPVTTIGGLAVIRDRFASSVGMNRPVAVIVQSPPTIATPNSNATTTTKSVEKK